MGDVAELAKENEQLKSQLAAHDTNVHQLQSHIDQLEQTLVLARCQRFGASSERTQVDQLRLFNEAEELIDQAESADGVIDESD